MVRFSRTIFILERQTNLVERIFLVFGLIPFRPQQNSSKSYSNLRLTKGFPRDKVFSKTKNAFEPKQNRNLAKVDF